MRLFFFPDKRRRAFVHAAAAVAAAAAAVFFLIPVHILAGCAIPGISLTVVPPDNLEQYGVSAWEVRWWDGDAVREKEWGTGREAVPSTLILPLDSGGAIRPVAVLVPRAGPAGDIPLAPVGGWLREGETTIHPDRHGGEIGEVLLALAAKGMDPALINVERLDQLIRSRLSRNPRRLDRARLVTALARREMRSYHVSERSIVLHQVRLLLPDRTVPWISDDPGENPYQPAPAGAYELFSVPVMEGEVRRLWRPCPAGRTVYQMLTVHRTPAGNTFHTLGEVPFTDVIARQN